jgi:fido (protein-threonine AMPylation protein)
MFRFDNRKVRKEEAMPYDDSRLKEFDSYYQAKSASLRERAENWAVAIGLQKVDGLVPSEHLISVAKRHIEGEISGAEATSLIDRYYETKSGHDAPEDVKEADKVSARINEVIEEEGFYLSPTYYTGLHGLIFEGVFPHAGSLREVNIRKREWVLRGDSVTYGHAPMIAKTLDYDFDREKEYSYSRKSKQEIVAHFARFIAGIWQIHPFREGNTRTTAVFAIKYLKSMRIEASNDLFAENSWFFRNALVRANYDNPLSGIARDFEPLERFLRNLILGEHNELKNRYLLVGLKDSEQAEFSTAKKSGQKKAVRKSGKKTVDKLWDLLKERPHLTLAGMTAALGITRSTIQKHLANLKAAGRLKRIGPDKGGHWEVTG